MITLLLGGARSGKSEIAERLAAAVGAPVTYVATLRTDIYDDTLEQRISAHRRRRPDSWRTVEVREDLPALLAGLEGTVLLDSLGPWLAALPDFAADADALVGALAARAGDTIIVSDEVGLGVIPATAIGGAFRDALGSLNRAVAAVADRVLLVVAGRVLPLADAETLFEMPGSVEEPGGSGRGEGAAEASAGGAAAADDARPTPGSIPADGR